MLTIHSPRVISPRRLHHPELRSIDGARGCVATRTKWPRPTLHQAVNKLVFGCDQDWRILDVLHWALGLIDADLQHCCGRCLVWTVSVPNCTSYQMTCPEYISSP